MIRIHRIVAGLVAVVAGAITLCAASSAAFAETAIPPAGPDNVGHHQMAPAETVLIGGMPGWQVALIAVGAALVASVAAVLVDRARSARRQLAPAS